MTTQRETTTAAGGSPVEREVGRLEPEHADGSEHYWDDRDEPFDELTCERCHGDGMDPWNDYLLPCPLCLGDKL